MILTNMDSSMKCIKRVKVYSVVILDIGAIKLLKGKINFH